jgi:hypothetical protein
MLKRATLHCYDKVVAVLRAECKSQDSFEEYANRLESSITRGNSGLKQIGRCMRGGDAGWTVLVRADLSEVPEKTAAWPTIVRRTLDRVCSSVVSPSGISGSSLIFLPDRAVYQFFSVSSSGMLEQFLLLLQGENCAALAAEFLNKDGGKLWFTDPKDPAVEQLLTRINTVDEKK